jgi:hypothetical protein
MLGQLFEPAIVKRYRRYRAAQRKLNSKLVKSALTEEAFDLAVRHLGVGKNHRLTLESEGELSVVMDYAICEAGKPGERVIDRYRAQAGSQDSMEQTLQDAIAASRMGLYRIESVDARLCQLHLKELAQGERTVTIMEINLSQSDATGYVLFTRLLELPELVMTGGAALPFPSEMEARLAKIWNTPAGRERYGRIFKLHRRHGISVLYASASERRGRRGGEDEDDSFGE